MKASPRVQWLEYGGTVIPKARFEALLRLFTRLKELILHKPNEGMIDTLRDTSISPRLVAVTLVEPLVSPGVLVGMLRSRAMEKGLNEQTGLELVYVEDPKWLESYSGLQQEIHHTSEFS